MSTFKEFLDEQILEPEFKAEWDRLEPDCATKNILRPHELPFAVPKDLANSINGLIGALERDDRMLDAYLMDVEGAARQVSEENDAWIRAYYVEGGWMNFNERHSL